MGSESNDPWAIWRNRLSASRTRRDDRVGEWQDNVDKRKGEATSRASAESTTTTATVTVNKDWPMTKAKIAQLYSQTPEVRLTPRSEEFRAAMSIFGRELNDTLTAADIGATIEEILADIVNASGIGAVLCSCEKRTEPREVPAVDPATMPPEMQQALMTGAMQMPMETVEHTVDIQHLAERISPADLLVPSDFTGSNYDKARWLGNDGRMTWAQAQTALGLTDEVKEKVLGGDPRSGSSSKTLNTDSTKFRDTDVVSYTQVFYWRHFYHADETSFKALQRVVFVDGLEEPVVNEPYTGQQRQPDGTMAGVTRNPIQICTLTYISDDCLPPSDSSVARPSINELEASRRDMMLQRKHSIPIRWGDTNRVGANTKAKLDAGNYQDVVWTNGPGDRAIGEVSRASFPPEKFEFDRVINGDITEIAQIGTNQAGAFAQGERSAREAGIIERNFQRRVGQEQDKVTKFLLGIAEVIAGHLALYGTFDLPDMLGQQRALLANNFTYSVRVDSTVRMDAEQRIEQLKAYVNNWAQSGLLNAKPIAEEWAELVGLDPASVVIDPKPKPPEPVKISVSNALDLHDEAFLAVLCRNDQAPRPQDVAAAKLLSASLALPVAPPQVPMSPDGGPPVDVQTPGIRNPDWQENPKINKREQDA
jgi:hypothetical protein